MWSKDRFSSMRTTMCPISSSAASDSSTSISTQPTGVSCPPPKSERKNPTMRAMAVRTARTTSRSLDASRQLLHSCPNVGRSVGSASSSSCQPRLEGGCMDEVSAKATLTAEIASPLAVNVPRSEVEHALQADAEADLILDVVRRNGQEETCRVVLSLDREALEQLLSQDGERVVAAIDPITLERAFDDVEAQGVREVGAALAILVATAAG